MTVASEAPAAGGASTSGSTHWIFKNREHGKFVCCMEYNCNRPLSHTVPMMALEFKCSQARSVPPLPSA